jgi:hypothetical protein
MRPANLLAGTITRFGPLLPCCAPNGRTHQRPFLARLAAFWRCGFRRDCLNLDMDFVDKARRGGTVRAKSRASGPRPTFDSTKSPDWAYDQGPAGAGAFVFLLIILGPEVPDRASVVFSFFEIPVRLSTRKMHIECQRISVMIDEKFARLRTFRNNINRYRRLLRTELSALERQFIERRLNEEESAMESLAISARTHVEKTHC